MFFLNTLSNFQQGRGHRNLHHQSRGWPQDIEQDSLPQAPSEHLLVQRACGLVGEEDWEDRRKDLCARGEASQGHWRFVKYKCTKIWILICGFHILIFPFCCRVSYSNQCDIINQPLCICEGWPHQLWDWTLFWGWGFWVVPRCQVHHRGRIP